MVRNKKCPRCGGSKPLDEFPRNRGRADGRGSRCLDCTADLQSARDRKRSTAADARDEETVRRAERWASDTEPLRADDFDVGVGNVPETDADKAKRAAASREKRQEFNRRMGETAADLRGAAEAQSRGDGDVLSNMSGESGDYIAKLAEQERRFGNRRMARSVAIAMAHEALSIRMFKAAAEQHLSAKIEPTGYALKPAGGNRKRTVCLLLSDLHLGAELSSLDEPMPFRAVEEARRLEYVVRQALDYKPQYREQSELLLLLNGDLIEGLLLHDLRDGAPLTEQKVIFWRYMSQALALFAQQFPRVRVVCQPGNHGRDKVRHPGRATSRKWDGHEWEMYYALRMMSSSLRNVEWQIDFRAASAIDLYGSWLGMTHGDTEVKLGDPDTKARENAAALDRINSTRTYGVEFAAWCVGHFHKPRYQPRSPRVIYNGALVPPNGYARGAGYVGESTGQFLWEAVEGYPVGDLRFVEVGRAQDQDERLGRLITPFRFQ